MNAAPYPRIEIDRQFHDLTFKFVIADETGEQWYGSKQQELPELLWCKSKIEPGFNVVDCGAHHGMVSVLFSSWVGPEGRVISYEALPANANIAATNLTINELSHAEVRPVGVSDVNGKVSVHLNQGNVMASVGDTSAEIDVVRLDDDVPGDMVVDFLKIDVEGSDLKALNGARRILAQRPIIDFEVHNFLFEDRKATLSKIFKILKPSIWTYEVLPQVISETVKIDGAIDIDWLATIDNPHVFCTPRGGLRYDIARWLARWRSKR